MTKIIYEAGSFRDPAGKIFYHDNQVYRELTEAGKKRFQFLNENNLLKKLIDKEFLIKTEIIDSKKSFKLEEESNLVIKHEKIDFISYPYEWTFDQL